MRLVLLGAWNWRTFVSEQVVDVLTDFGSAKGPKKAMLSLLRESVPQHGPQEGNRTVCKQLSPRSVTLSEFRKGEYPGTKIRVIWFYGDEPTRRDIICVHAFAKNDEETPVSEIRAAMDLKQEYFEAREKNRLVIDKV